MTAPPVSAVLPASLPVADRPAVLGDVGGPQAAATLVARLVAEGVGARAVGGQVWVREADRFNAVVLARLFHEVDAGRSRVAPAPGTWCATRTGMALRALVVALLVVPAVLALLVAVRL